MFVCECMRTTQTHTLLYFISNSVIQTCGFCNPRCGQRKKSNSMAGSAEGRDPLCCPFTPSFHPWGDTTAAARREHQPLMDAQWLLFVVPRRERVACTLLWRVSTLRRTSHRCCSCLNARLHHRAIKETSSNNMSSLHSAEAALMYLYEGGQLSTPYYTAQGTAK